MKAFYKDIEKFHAEVQHILKHRCGVARLGGLDYDTFVSWDSDLGMFRIEACPLVAHTGGNAKGKRSKDRYDNLVPDIKQEFSFCAAAIGWENHIRYHYLTMGDENGARISQIRVDDVTAYNQRYREQIGGAAAEPEASA